MNEYFPKLCPPTCGLEINLRRIKGNDRIKIFTQARVKEVSGEAGAYTVTAELAPRHVNANCTLCDKCTPACPEERKDAFNYGMGTTRAIYLPHGMAYPHRYVIDEQACPGESCGRCVAYCPYDAIDLAQKPRTLELAASAVVMATGWRPYDASKMENLAFGRYPDVITNAMMERMAARNGPFEGKIQRLSDGGAVERVAFVQCAGSRDEHHLGFCSGVCCSATFKQATYVREQYPEAEIHIFYIDLRTMGILEDFYEKVVKEDPKIFLHKGKVARIERAVGQHGVTVVAEEIISGKRKVLAVDLAVLATGMQPEEPVAPADWYDHYGFITGGAGAGCAKRPQEVAGSVRDATAGALRAIQTRLNAGQEPADAVTDQTPHAVRS